MIPSSKILKNIIVFVPNENYVEEYVLKSRVVGQQVFLTLWLKLKNITNGREYKVGTLSMVPNDNMYQTGIFCGINNTKSDGSFIINASGVYIYANSVQSGINYALSTQFIA